MTREKRTGNFQTVAIVGIALAALAFAAFALLRSEASPLVVNEGELRRTNMRLAVVRDELEALPDFGVESEVSAEGCVYDGDAYDADVLRQPSIARTFQVGERDNGDIDTQVGQALLARGWRGDGEPDHGIEVFFFDRGTWTAVAALDGGEIRVSIDEAKPCSVRY